MNGKPTAKQKRFHDWCRSVRCVLSKDDPVIHHIKGAKMKLKGVEGYAGEWYVVPLSDYYHNPQSKNSVHENRKQFERNWATQKSLWLGLMYRYLEEFGEYPMSAEEYLIIKDRA